MKRYCKITLLFFLMLFTTQQSIAQEDWAIIAQRSAQELAQTREELKQLDKSKDRVKALTKMIGALERGLAVLRESHLQFSLSANQIRKRLNTQEESTRKLISALYNLDREPIESQILHPKGALDTARAGMLLTEITPAFQARVSQLRSDLNQLTQLQAQQKSATDELKLALQALQDARKDLSRAATDRRDLPKRFTEDPIKKTLLLNATESLSEFANEIAIFAQNEVTVSLPEITQRKGHLPFPVEGRILRNFNESDASGTTRPGIIVATQSKAVVKTPTAATLRYSGPFLDYGLISILEPENGTLFIFAGLDQVYGKIGQVLPASSPIGMMGGKLQTFDEFLNYHSTMNTSDRPETIYIEIRQDNKPQDPLEWFRINRD